MKMVVFNMKIVEKTDKGYEIRISRDDEFTNLIFNPETREISYTCNNGLTRLLKQNHDQLKKMLINKREDTFFEGFNLKFALRNKKDVASFDDKEKIIVLDKRSSEQKSYAVDKEKAEDRIHKIYTDASFLEKLHSGAYCILIKDLKGEYRLYRQKSDKKNSALLEMMAAIKGLEILKDITKIRIVTDSWYVRKGLTEWVVNWKLNNWYTVNGEKVKHIRYWKKFDRLTQGKYIEFEWVKGHSKHFENTLCDLFAKEIAGE